MEDKIKAALANIDKIVSSTSMSRQEHLVLADNIELLKTVGEGYLLLCEADEEE